MTDEDLPPALAAIARDLASLPAEERVQLLVELGDELPDPPERLRVEPGLLEAVRECQSPIYVRAEVGPAGGGSPTPDGAAGSAVDGSAVDVVHLHVSAPPQAPVTRGFAGLLHAGVDGRPVDEVLDLPADLPARLSLEGIVSPLRLRGMAGLLARVQRQVAEATGR